jgi:NADH-quinone oxidoreductase E subunit
VIGGGITASGTGPFAYSAENQARAEAIIARYPEGRQASAVIPLLDLAQRQYGGWLPKEAMDHVADLLHMAPIRVYEVATFYTMFNLKPVGRHLVQVCRTTPCWLRGSDGILKACMDKLGIAKGETTADGKFTLVEVECLGACCNAPMVQINDHFFEDLTPQIMADIIDRLGRGDAVEMGSQAGRQGSAPQGGPRTLTSIPAQPAGAEGGA